MIKRLPNIQENCESYKIHITNSLTHRKKKNNTVILHVKWHPSKQRHHKFSKDRASMKKSREEAFEVYFVSL